MRPFFDGPDHNRNLLVLFGSQRFAGICFETLVDGEMAGGGVEVQHRYVIKYNCD